MASDQRQPPTSPSKAASAPFHRSFDGFYAEEYHSVVVLAYVLSGSRSGAEDLAQEAFLAAFRRWDTIGLYEDPGGSLRRIQLRDYIRRVATQPEEDLCLDDLPPVSRDRSVDDDTSQPTAVDEVETSIRGVAGVREVSDLRVRWHGHQLRIAASIAVDADLTVKAGHDTAHDVEHAPHHHFSFPITALIHVDPHGLPDAHDATAHHQR